MIGRSRDPDHEIIAGVVTRLIDALNETAGHGARWLVLACILISAGNAIVRYTVNMSSNAWLEMQWYLNAAMFLLVASYALKKNAHVRIDVIISKLSPRTQAWIDIVGALLFLIPVSLIIAWYSWPALVNSYDIGEMSSDPGGLIRWPMRLVIPVAFVLLILQGVSEIIKRVAFLRGLIPDPVDHHHHEEIA